MANSMNTVVLCGNLVADPEVRTVGNTTKANLRLAVNKRFTDANKEQKERTLYIDCEVWGNQAEIAKKFLRKGRAVLLRGELMQDTWQDKDGNKRSKIYIRIDEFSFVNDGKAGANEEPVAVGTSEDMNDIDDIAF